MGIFSKIKNKIKKAIPREIAPFLPAIASIFGGPMIAGMFGAGMNPMLAQGLGAFLADAGTQELTSDRTRLESSLFSGIMGAARGIQADPRLNVASDPNFIGPSQSLTPGTETYKAAFGNLGTKDKILQGARSFARAPLDNPIIVIYKNV